jgi:hypothetical protein
MGAAAPTRGVVVIDRGVALVVVVAASAPPKRKRLRSTKGLVVGGVPPPWATSREALVEIARAAKTKATTHSFTALLVLTECITYLGI